MIRDAIAHVVEGKDLTTEQAHATMLEMMEGRATQSQIGSFMTAMRMKGENEGELLGFALAMREKSSKIASPEGTVDLCGTGGDKSGTFNISTTASFVVAAAGVPVAKHGNKSVSSKCGSADVLAAMRVPFDLDPAQVGQCISMTGMGFMFAPTFHASMRNVSAPRRELGLRTFFNVLGPMTNPAGVKSQLIGVYDPALGPTMARVLRAMGTSHAMLVHGDGLDEISTSGTTRVAELLNGQVFEYDLDPGSFGIDLAEAADLRGGDSSENARTMLKILKGEDSARSDAVALNAGAALYVAGHADNIREGLDQAVSILRRGRAFEKLKQFATVASEFERERQMRAEPVSLTGRHIVPKVLAERSKELSSNLLHQVSEVALGRDYLQALDPALLSRPNILSVIVLRRILRLMEKQDRPSDARRPGRRRLSDALVRGRLAIIAEFKPSSPSSGPLAVAPDPELVAKAYDSDGIAGVSVLVEPDFFSGSPELFSLFRAKLSAPMLFKDFVVTSRQIDQAASLGADAVLLIAKALRLEALDSLAVECVSRGMEPLVEIHDEQDLEKLLQCDCFDAISLVGINSRDLRTLETNLSGVRALNELMPAGKHVIAESGVRVPADLARLKGFDAALIGSAFMRSDDVGRTVQEMVRASRGVTA